MSRLPRSGGAPAPTTRQLELPLDATPRSVCRDLREGQSASLLLDGGGGFENGWDVGPLVAVAPQLALDVSRSDGAGNVEAALTTLDGLIAERRAIGGTRETGVAVLLSYGALEPAVTQRATGGDLVALTVDRSLRFVDQGTAVSTVRGSTTDAEKLRDRIVTLGQDERREAARGTTRPTTSLPREAYLDAVSRVQEHITRGDIYQANLCQRFEVDYVGDVFETYVRLAEATPAPRSAFLELPGWALVSVSPETFLRQDEPRMLETWPIKGTCPRGSSPEEDRAAAAGLLRSEKDRAELLMIVDLERNDLSRVCRAGSVEVPVLAGLRSYAAVHHLVACVRGELAAGVEPSRLLRATFPGGSITGAPKIRAMEILRALEPVGRGLFTGSLLWFGDDGSLDSSILIRSWVFGDKRARLGAGGGIVADSDPEQEWQESNHKARALAQALGFDPEEAS